jgi:hypothetical protein
MRFLSGTRAISIALRTLHLAAFGLLLGGHAFAVEPARLLPYLSLTVLSGIGLIALELHAVGLYWLFLGKGLMVLLKLAVLLLIPFFWEARVILLLLVVGIASVGSHMPARLRHYSILHRRVIGPGEALGPAFFPRAPAGAALSGVNERPRFPVSSSGGTTRWESVLLGRRSASCSS